MDRCESGVTCQLSVHRCQKQFFPHSGQPSCHPGSLSQSHSYIPTWGHIFHPTFVIIVSPRHWFAGQINNICLGCHGCGPCNQPTTEAVSLGRPTPPPSLSTKCTKGRAKTFFACQISVSPCSSSLSPLLILDLAMSDSFYLMWKKNTEINYLIFLML